MAQHVQFERRVAPAPNLDRIILHAVLMVRQCDRGFISFTPGFMGAQN